MTNYVGPWGNREAGPRSVRPIGSPALDWFGKTLMQASEIDGRTTIDVSVADVHALGNALRRIASGEDARHVFAQVKVGHRQDDRMRNQTIAMIYWQTLAELLAAGEVSEAEAQSAALDRAGRHFADKHLDAATVRRYARQHRDSVLRWINTMHQSGKGVSPAALLAYLEKHSRRGRWAD